MVISRRFEVARSDQPRTTTFVTIIARNRAETPMLRDLIIRAEDACGGMIWTMFFMRSEEQDQQSTLPNLSICANITKTTCKSVVASMRSRAR